MTKITEEIIIAMYSLDQLIFDVPSVKIASYNVSNSFSYSAVFSSVSSSTTSSVTDILEAGSIGTIGSCTGKLTTEHAGSWTKRLSDVIDREFWEPLKP